MSPMTHVRHTLTAATALALGIAAGGWLFGSRPEAHAQARPSTSNQYQIVESTGAGTFLLNRSTGDTFKWFRDTDTGRSGWQFHALPSRVDGCTMEGWGGSTDEEFRELCREEAHERSESALGIDQSR